MVAVNMFTNQAIFPGNPATPIMTPNIVQSDFRVIADGSALTSVATPIDAPLPPLTSGVFGRYYPRKIQDLIVAHPSTANFLIFGVLTFISQSFVTTDSVDGLNFPLLTAGLSELRRYFINLKSDTSLASSAPTDLMALKRLRDLATKGNEIALNHMRTLDVTHLESLALNGNYVAILGIESLAEFENEVAVRVLVKLIRTRPDVLETIEQFAVRGDSKARILLLKLANISDEARVLLLKLATQYRWANKSIASFSENVDDIIKLTRGHSFMFDILRMVVEKRGDNKTFERLVILSESDENIAKIVIKLARTSRWFLYDADISFLISLARTNICALQVLLILIKRKNKRGIKVIPTMPKQFENSNLLLDFRNFHNTSPVDILKDIAELGNESAFDALVHLEERGRIALTSLSKILEKGIQKAFEVMKLLDVKPLLKDTRDGYDAAVAIKNLAEKGNTEAIKIMESHNLDEFIDQIRKWSVPRNVSF